MDNINKREAINELVSARSKLSDLYKKYHTLDNKYLDLKRKLLSICIENNWETYIFEFRKSKKHYDSYTSYIVDNKRVSLITITFDIPINMCSGLSHEFGHLINAYSKKKYNKLNDEYNAWCNVIKFLDKNMLTIDYLKDMDNCFSSYYVNLNIFWFILGCFYSYVLYRLFKKLKRSK